MSPVLGNIAPLLQKISDLMNLAATNPVFSNLTS